MITGIAGEDNVCTLILTKPGDWRVTAELGLAETTKVVTVEDIVYRVSLGIGETRLPEGYTEVKYVDFDGATYIDVNPVSLLTSYSGTITMELLPDSTSGYVFGGHYQRYISSNAYRTYASSLQYDGTDMVFRSQYNTGTASVPSLTSGVKLPAENRKMVISWDPNTEVFRVNDSSIAYTPATSTLVAISLGCLYSSRRLSSAASGGTYYESYLKFRLYNYSINAKADGSEYRDYVPAIRDSDGVVGLYDLVTDAFATPSVGSLTAGPVV